MVVDLSGLLDAQTAPPTLRTLLDGLPIGVAYVDAQCRYVLINKWCEEWWGVPRADVIGQRVQDLFPDDWPMWQEGVLDALAGRPTTQIEVVRYPRGLYRMRSIRTPDTGLDGRVRGYTAAYIPILGQKTH